MEKRQNYYMNSAQCSLQTPVRYLHDRCQEVAEDARTHWHAKSDPETVSTVVNAMTAKLSAMDSSLIIRFRWYHNLGCTVPLWSSILRSPVKVTGIHMLMQILIDSFY